MKRFTLLTLMFGLLWMNSFAAEDPTTLSSPQQVLPMSAQSLKNKTDGEAFLATNKTNPGVVTLPDGLQYKVIVEGTGDRPTKNDSVIVHYAGTLIDGTEFDSSYKRGEPISFPVSRVIAGWVEALQLMQKGATWELYIPSNLAYGERGAPPTIGPNETLIFKVQLIDIVKD